jgi:hypothetical protein
MELFALSFLVIVIAMLGMSVGTICGRRPIRGTCGGVGGAVESRRCPLCAGSPEQDAAAPGAGAPTRSPMEKS